MWNAYAVVRRATPDRRRAQQTIAGMGPGSEVGRVEYFMNTFEEDLVVGSNVEERDFEMLRFSAVFSC